MSLSEYLTSAQLAESMNLSRVRICQLVAQLKSEGTIVGEMVGSHRVFSPADAKIVRDMDRRHYTK
jgi:DNA-binding transcriptional regulator LsrR (DeoR family)